MMFFVALIFATLALAQYLPPPTPPAGLLEQPPILGFGTWYLRGDDAVEAVANAIQKGYRHIDAAFIYYNQRQIGQGIKEGIRRANITRQDLWITSKLWNTRHEDAEFGLNEVLGQLGLDYLDLFLVHWPMGNSTGSTTFDYLTAWKGMEKLIKDNGKTRSIGISNFSPKQVDQVLKVAKIKPLVHQIELHPYLAQTAFVEELQNKGMIVTAYAPLGNTNPVYGSRGSRVGKLLRNPVMTEIATARGCTPAQVSLAWNMRRNVVVIPKASNATHRAENLAAYEKCKITDEDAANINAISQKAAYRMNGNLCTPEPLRNACWEGLSLGT